MKKNTIFQKSQKQRLVITNSRRNLLQKISSVDKRRPSLEQQEFKLKIEESKENQTNNYLQSKECSFKPSFNKKMQSQEKRSAYYFQALQAKNITTIENQKQDKNVQRAYTSTSKTNFTTNKRRRGNSILQRNDLNISTFSEQVLEIYEILNQSFIIRSNSSHSIALKKEKFHQILESLLQTISQQKLSYPQKQEISACILYLPFQKIKTKINSIKLISKSTKLMLKSNLLRIQYTQQEYKTQVTEIKQTLSGLKQQNEDLTTQIASKKEELQFMSVLRDQKQQQIIQMFKKSNQLQEFNTKLQTKLTQTLSNISKHQELLRQLKEKSDNLLTFVEKQQEKKILHAVSEAYKQIQADIYDYATYLQCNSMASSLIWEPKPFRAVENWVYQQMERVNRFVMSSTEPLEAKWSKMKDFITNTTRKFRTKDQQMMKITDYKTECIKKYIKMMQKWLENWELKQEYLLGLRNEFVVYSGQINGILMELQTTCNQDRGVSKLLEKLREKWDKVELNYKYGNSFY